MTALESQLAALAASAGIDRSKRPKGQPSLLHDPQTAADIDAQSVLDTAIKGAPHRVPCRRAFESAPPTRSGPHPALRRAPANRG